MKMHAGVDAKSELIHSVACTAANEADVAHAHSLLHGQEHPLHVIKNVFGYREVRFRTITKNEARAGTQTAMANLYIARERLPAQGVSASEA